MTSVRDRPDDFSSIPPATDDPGAAPAGWPPERRAAWARLRASLRPGQREMADWQGGPLAVSAVPGAGKSTGMAQAAALAIARHGLNYNRQLVVVTFTRSAAANLKAKIRAALQELGLPTQGFSARTLHSLAFQIASRDPERSGLDRDASLAMPERQHRLIRQSADRWAADFPREFRLLLEGGSFDGEEAERLRRQSVLRTEVLPDLAYAAIHEAKSSGLMPDDLRRLARAIPVAPDPDDLAGAGDRYPLLDIAAGLYEAYQTALRSQNFIDYDDAILGALRVLADPEARRLWQARTFAVFEDEAQDSTPLQSRLLRVLAADPDAEPTDPTSAALPDSLNLVRVGDPNQAINSTFTPADPIFFRAFCDRCRTRDRLAVADRSGRSSREIIDAANFLLQWVNGAARTGDPNAGAIAGSPPDDLPFQPQTIRPVDPDDPQPDANPAPLGRGFELWRPPTIHDTILRIGQRASALFAADPAASAAVLVRTNDQGRYLAQTLADNFGYDLPLFEVGQRDRQSHVPGEILTLLQFLDRPHSPDNLKAALRVLVDRKLVPAQDLDRLASAPEQFLYPGPLDPPQPEPVRDARRYCTGLLRARLDLPHDRLVPFLALTLNYDRPELATADKLADTLFRRSRGDARMATTLEILLEIVNAERFEPVDADDSPESPYTRAGRLAVITMHKAKGLDWDAVFIPFLQANTLPGNSWVPLQARFLGDFSLPECARAQVRSLARATAGEAIGEEPAPLPDLTRAWRVAQRLKAAEEYRLLYVAATRAKRLLCLAAAREAPFTWNVPDNLQEMPPCPALEPLARQFPQAMGRDAPGGTLRDRAKSSG